MLDDRRLLFSLIKRIWKLLLSYWTATRDLFNDWFAVEEQKSSDHNIVLLFYLTETSK